MQVKIWYSLLFLFLTCSIAQAQNAEAFLRDDTLTLQNDKIALSYLWNGGALKAVQLLEKGTGNSFHFSTDQPGFLIDENVEQPISANLKVEENAASANIPAHTSATVETNFKNWKLRQIFRIFPETPAVAVELYYRGRVSWQKKHSKIVNPDGVEVEVETSETVSEAGRIGFLGIQGNHWSIKAVEFNDATDDNNNLVHEKSLIIYTKPIKLSGNVFIAEELPSGNRFFILKEAPLDKMQLAYPGHDITVQAGKLAIHGIGLEPEDINNEGWTRGYGYVIGAGGNSALKTLTAIKTYLKAKSPFNQDQGKMIMANTWGDRSRDERMNEKFVLQELEAGAKLGITHFQLDDGWQTGLSKNSGSEKGKLWRLWDKESWKPHPTRFPNGLEPVVQKARSLEIEPALWFHPSSGSSFKNWRQDAEILIDLYRRYDIKYFKMDGIEIQDKEADRNLRFLLDSVKVASGGEVFFNLDATAGRRTGFFYMNEYGNIFLENRYTDWGNYYPTRTLRNLWMLSKYIPPKNLQIEFLNKWRNSDKYAENDSLAPINYDFEYLFATSMMSQPLAWMELSSLPEEAFSVAPVVKKYKIVMNDIHAGTILPIGNMPTGFTWTGFQSIQEKTGYFLIFRENNAENNFKMETWLEGSKTVRISPLLHPGETFETTTGANGMLEFTVAEPNSYSLLSYKIIEN
ncbi:alpha-galactosidase [Zunongwangia sp. F260]|uniref:Alpha-galactosidase n=1 Tax=Autumnicola lenta TaxID=3075593 RepID=A0ABU3CNT5_9FLAO|nr:alpha-galactosidase [Zunongwangia sp. F260]MDT0648017.1 alpha-galactosidase [Zunongwangia sp. F260]